jgi:SnoaL-like domain
MSSPKETRVDTERICERYVEVMMERDLEAQHALLHPDVVARYPQSGEVFRGRDNYIGMLRNYPGLPMGQVTSIKGESHTSVQYPALPTMAPTITVYGGDDFVVEALATYADGSMYNIVILLHLERGLVKEETSYFAASFEAPEWRRPYADAG